MNQRIFIYPKDLAILTGKSYVNACRIYRILKDCMGKPKKSKITVKEYCTYEGVSETEVKEALKIK